MPATVERLEYDPNRTAFIALIKYEDGELAYILAPQRLAVGDSVIVGRAGRREAGQRHAARRHAGRHHRPQYRDEAGQGRPDRALGRHLCAVSSAATQATRILRLNSGEARMVPADCMATVGAVSNPDHMNEVDRQGRPQRWKGKRPSVRGVAMNPVDHPHGGGEGRTTGGRHPVTPVGQADQGQQDAQATSARPSSSCVSRHAQEEARVDDMTRSVWKGPFVDGYLLKKAEKPRAAPAATR